MQQSIKKRNNRLVAAFCAVASAAAAVYTFAQSTEPSTIRDGVFSTAQVERGRELFNGICTDCHEIEEFTGVGAYLEEQEGETLWDVFEYIWAEMPEDNPASLEPNEYADVLAYVLSVYGMPAGAADMPIERAPLDKVKIARPVLPGS
jgi:mono/diheme cytochrome c family protein